MLCKIGGLLLICFTACRKDSLPLPVFRELQLPTNEALTSVWFTDSLHGFVTGGAPWERGELWSTADGGANWQLDTAVSKVLECVMFDKDGQGYACGQDGLALLRPVGQPHWHTFRVDFTWHRSCYFPNGREGVIVSGDGFMGGGIRKLGPDAIWLLDTMHLYTNALSAVWYSDSLTVHATGLGWVLRSDDGGRNWERLPPTDDFFRSIHFPTATTGYICGYSGTLLKTTDGGRTWNTIREGGSVGKKHQAFRAVWFVSAEKGYLVGDNGLFWRTENGGADWTALAGLPNAVDASDIFVLDNKGWITAGGGRIFHFEE